MVIDFCLDSRELATDTGSAWDATFDIVDDVGSYSDPVFTVYRGDTVYILADTDHGTVVPDPDRTNAFVVNLPAASTEIEPGYYDYSFKVTRDGDGEPYTVAAGRFRVEYLFPTPMMGVRSPLYTLNRHDVQVKAGRALTLGITFDGEPPPEHTEDLLFFEGDLSPVANYDDEIPANSTEHWMTIPATDTEDLTPGRYYYVRALRYPTKTVTVAKGLLWVLPEVPT